MCTSDILPGYGRWAYHLGGRPGRIPYIPQADRHLEGNPVTLAEVSQHRLFLHKQPLGEVTERSAMTIYGSSRSPLTEANGGTSQRLRSSSPDPVLGR